MEMERNATTESVGSTSAYPTAEAGSDGESIMDLAKSFIILYCYPIISAIGLLGNGLSFCLMVSKNIQTRSTSIFLASLAVSDTMVILYIAIVHWYGEMFNKGFYLQTVLLEKLQMFWMRFPLVSSAWLIVVVCGERLLITWLPLKAAIICRPRNAYTAVVIILTLSAVYSVVSAAIPGVRTPSIEAEGIEVAETLSLSVLYSFLPIILLLVMSTPIAVKLRRIGIKNMSQTSDSLSNKMATRATIVVLCICVAYVVFTLPGVIVFPVYRSLARQGHPPPEKDLVEHICFMALLMNHSFNFFFYTMVSSKFRQRLFELLCGWCRRKNKTEERVPAIIELPEDIVVGNTENHSAPTQSTSF